MNAPEINNSSKEEREDYIRQMFQCKGDCDACGVCQVYHGMEPEIIFQDYIDGKRSFMEIAMEYR